MLQVNQVSRAGRANRVGRVGRLPLVAAAALASLVTVPASAHAASYAQAGPGRPGALLPPPVPDEDRAGGDHLTVTVRHAGDASDGTYELYCHPDAGSHPDAGGACRAVDRNTRWGRDTFAPVPEGSVCTMLYGGPATAHVTGTWAGRPIDATYDRSNGCEIARWNRMVPLLPNLGS
jgi:hypothetical protein